METEGGSSWTSGQIVIYIISSTEWQHEGVTWSDRTDYSTGEMC